MTFVASASDPTAGAAIGADGKPQCKNMRLIGHCGMDGRGDIFHINVYKGYAFCGHQGTSRIGTSVIDVSDPRKPFVVAEIPAPPHIHSTKVQVVDNVLLVNYERFGWQLDARPVKPGEKGDFMRDGVWKVAGSKETGTGGLKSFDVSNPKEPKELGFIHFPGKGSHRHTWWEYPYAYAAGSDDGWEDQFLITVDMSDPTRMKEVGRWWIPGQHVAGGEKPAWLEQGLRYALHHGIPRGNTLYLGYWDAGLVILDNSDPGKPKLLSHLQFDPRESRDSHSPSPVPGRDILVLTDEETKEEDINKIEKRVRIIDISDGRNPRVISMLPIVPKPPKHKGRFGPHNVHEGRPGSLQDGNTLYVTYFGGGVRVYDIKDATNPREIAYFVPAPPPGRLVSQIDDVMVTPDGLIYIGDRRGGGLYILEMTGRD
jgi:hypothetical protein